VLWMGIYPGSFQAPMKPAVAAIVARLDGVQLATVPTDMTILQGAAPQTVPAGQAARRLVQVEAAH